MIPPTVTLFVSVTVRFAAELNPNTGMSLVFVHAWLLVPFHQFVAPTLLPQLPLPSSGPELVGRLSQVNVPAEALTTVSMTTNVCQKLLDNEFIRRSV